jgi:hypothetical protein
VNGDRNQAHGGHQEQRDTIPLEVDAPNEEAPHQIADPLFPFLQTR